MCHTAKVANQNEIKHLIPAAPSDVFVGLKCISDIAWVIDMKISLQIKTNWKDWHLMVKFLRSIPGARISSFTTLYQLLKNYPCLAVAMLPNLYRYLLHSIRVVECVDLNKLVCKEK